MQSKGYRLLVWGLIFLGCLQSLAVLNGNLALYLFAKSSGASPLSAAFNGLNGIEFWALNIQSSVETDLGEKSTVSVNSEFAKHLDYPYFVRITYAFPFAFSEINPKPIAQDVMRRYLCHDEKFKAAMKVQGKITSIKISSQEKSHPEKIHLMEQNCL